MIREPEIRERVGLMQREVARLLGISHTRVGELERRALKKIARAITLEAAAAGLSVAEWLRE